MSDFAQTVKQQADIVKVIEGYIRLRKAGAQNFTGLCPFHKEKIAFVLVQRGRGSSSTASAAGVSGDVFTFVGKIENVGFPEAVRIVAQKCGIPLPKREFSSPKKRPRRAAARQSSSSCTRSATAWFEEQLRGPEGALAREYLAGRGLDPEGIKNSASATRPTASTPCEERLSGMADRETLRASGLFSSKEHEDGTHGPLYDRFRKRVMFPIANESGRVIAFTARTLETGEKAGAKYINSPETPLYSKGQVLFNLDKARSVDPPSWICAAGRRPDGLHLGLPARHSERDRHQRDGLHRAAGGDSASGTPRTWWSTSIPTPPEPMPPRSRSRC